MLIKRRQVLNGLAGIGMAPLLAKSLAAAEATANQTILVVVYLQGGNDGLNTVIPLPQYSNYAKLRTPAAPPQGLALAYAESDLELLAFNADYTVPALSATEYAFAPSMLAMRDLYTTGKLAVINGIGLPKAETNALSHSNASMDWLTGQINIDVGLAQPPGWLGLALDPVAGGALGPTASLSGTTPLLIGAKKQAVVINPPMDYFGVSFGVSDNQVQLDSFYNKIAVLPAASTTGVLNEAVMQTALSDISVVQQIARKQRATAYPLQSWLDYQLRDVARLIIGGAGIRGYFAQQGGYDTHTQQALSQPLLLQQFSQSLVNFYEFLSAAGAAANVVVATVSDFGRRPAANLDFGTDHGGATVSFVFGEKVKGGVYGTYPSLRQFDANGNLAMNIDFRNLLHDLILALGSAPPSYLGTWSPIGFIR
jgi:uncharacterized protein (DUF1501 family)